MSGRDQGSPPLAGVLAALTEPSSVLAEALLDEANLHQLCGLVDDDGPDTDRKGARLALAGLLAA